jgi:hypothetical protein
MEWPFKYGPQGANSWDHWDSDFCQLGAWEHARWRFLQNARSAMNSDIDELVLSKSGQSVFEAAEHHGPGSSDIAGDGSSASMTASAAALASRRIDTPTSRFSCRRNTSSQGS